MLDTHSKSMMISPLFQSMSILLKIKIKKVMKKMMEMKAKKLIFLRLLRINQEN